jgi:hypothetical protein
MSILKKEGQDFWPPGVPRPKAPAAPVPATTNPVPKIPGLTPSPSVVSPHMTNGSVLNMQKAIQDLSREIAGEKLNPQTKTLAPINNNFNSFIGNHYVKSLEKPAAQNPDEPTTPVAAPTGASTQSVMQHLSGLDNNKTFRPDGAWGPKTNTALDNIYKLAYSLLQLVGDFALSDDKIYNSTWLNGFKEKLTGYTFKNSRISLDPKEQEDRANSLIKHINAIGRLYTTLKQQISGNPTLRSHIEDKKPFENYNETGVNLTPEEEQFSRGDATIPTMPYAAPKLPNKKLDYIPLKNLRSKKDYLDWMMGYAGVPTETEAVSIFNNFIKRKLETT